MKYQKGYKYKLASHIRIRAPFADKFVEKGATLGNEWVYVDCGYLHIQRGYAWNGANVIPDTAKVMFPSIVHDAWYQLLREGHVPFWTREDADQWFGDLCYERGTNRLLADIYIVALGAFGEWSAIRDGRPIITVT